MHTDTLTTLLADQLVSDGSSIDDAAAVVAALPTDVLNAFALVVDQVLTGETRTPVMFAAAHASSKKVMKAFAKSGDKDLMRLAAEHTTFPNHLDYLSRQWRHPDVVVIVASRTSSPTNVLERLASSDCDGTRIAVAGNPSTPDAVLEELARDRCRAVRMAVLTNPCVGVRRWDSVRVSG